MAISREVRNQIREDYDFACGYCHVSEMSVGGELEIDHFQPISKDGNDAPQNLVYACTICNRFKSNYWPTESTPENLYLLHPQRDNLTEHIQESQDGRLFGVTSRGWFHIRWLNLNRPQLIAFRQLKLNQQSLKELLSQTEATNNQLRNQIQTLQTEIIQLRIIIEQLRG